MNMNTDTSLEVEVEAEAESENQSAGTGKGNGKSPVRGVSAQTWEEQRLRDWNRIRDLIEHIFTQYPQISPSMLQISLALRAEEWRPVLEEMVGEGLVSRWNSVRETPVTGRRQTYTTLLWKDSNIVYGVQPAKDVDLHRRQDQES